MSQFETLFARVLERTPLLCPPQTHDKSLSTEILRADLFNGKSGPYVEACRAGLLLWNDDLDAAHAIVQSPETQINNFWHAILHRREGDFSNARYWWGRTKTHDAMEEIFDLVIHKVPDFPLIDDLRQSQRWEPVAFTDFCEQSRKTGEWDTELRETQRLEMKTLLEWCAVRAR